jgi:protein SCO1
MRGTAAALVVAACLLAGASAVAQGHDPKDHRFAPPPPESLGGSFALRDTAGRTVTMEALRGRWTFYYFGYSRCTDTCPLALPTMVEAARVLNLGRTPTRAVFVDIEPPASTVRPRNAAISATSLGHHAKSGPGSPIMEIQERFGTGLLALTGSRAQLNAATVAFGVRREHVPARPLEEGHSINHTSFIYIVAPDGAVKGYVMHDVTADALVREVRRRVQGRS